MEKIVQIIGAEEIANRVVKLICIPYTTGEVQKKKISMLDMAMKGTNISEMVSEIQGEKKQYTHLYISRDEWINTFHNKLYSTIKLNISLEKELNR